MRGDVFALRPLKSARGHEQSGRRYAVVVQSDALLLSTLLVAPTSTAGLDASFRPRVQVRGAVTKVLVEQAAAVDPSRLGQRVGRLTPEDLRAVDAALRLVLGL